MGNYPPLYWLAISTVMLCSQTTPKPNGLKQSTCVLKLMRLQGACSSAGLVWAQLATLLQVVDSRAWLQTVLRLSLLPVCLSPWTRTTWGSSHGETTCSLHGKWQEHRRQAQPCKHTAISVHILEVKYISRPSPEGMELRCTFHPKRSRR